MVFLQCSTQAQVQVSLKTGENTQTASRAATNPKILTGAPEVLPPWP